MSTLDSLVTKLIAEKQLTTTVASKVELNQLRVGAYLKLQAHIKQWDDLGYLSDGLRDATVSIKTSKNSDGTLNATLLLVKKRKPLQFTIISPSSEATDHETVSTDLEHNQSCEIQHRSTDSDSQGYGTHVDSGCPQGESNGQRSTEADWESELRKFIESDSD